MKMLIAETVRGITPTENDERWGICARAFGVESTIRRYEGGVRRSQATRAFYTAHAQGATR
jgi:hypothetical protein